jgi:hypothetical protein
LRTSRANRTSSHRRDLHTYKITPTLKSPWMFSFDLGGAMRGAPYHGDMFCAEVKNYQHASDQGTQFDEFVAKCYIACQTGHLLSDHLMWITWAPFRAN